MCTNLGSLKNVYLNGHQFRGYYDPLKLSTQNKQTEVGNFSLLIPCRQLWFSAESPHYGFDPSEIPNIARSLGRWATLNLSTSRTVSVHVLTQFLPSSNALEKNFQEIMSPLSHLSAQGAMDSLLVQFGRPLLCVSSRLGFAAETKR